jgi:ribosome-associated toxin RatA of RatAB toxin-antitoxin module
MAHIQRSAMVPFSCEQMFDLVNDIEQYPEFLLWCPQARVLSQTDNEIEATVYFAKGAIAQAFTTINRLHPHEKIDMRLKEGPFRYLEGIWQFQVRPQGSQISLDLSFEFSNKLFSFALEPIFQQIAGTLVEAFTQRAHLVYA